jgi:hypothetical protein
MNDNYAFMTGLAWWAMGTLFGILVGYAWGRGVGDLIHRNCVCAELPAPSPKGAPEETK